MNTKLLLLFFPLLVYAQDYEIKIISAPVSEIVTKIAAYDVFTGESSGFSGGPSPQYMEYLKLVEIASLSELKELTDHTNPVMRCYAFDAICEKRDTSLVLEIAKKHVTDHAIIKTMSGCLVNEKMAGDVMLEAATYGDDYHKRVLSESQVNELDRGIIESTSKLLYKDTAIEKLQPTEDNYLKLRKLLISGKSNGAMVKLSEYKKESDIPLFIDSFNSIKKSDYDYLSYYAFNRAVINFPHPELFPLLQTEMLDVIKYDYVNPAWQTLYDAIAAYGNQKAAVLLSAPFHNIENDQIRRHHMEFVFNAVNRFPSENYKAICWELWEKADLTDTEICDALFADNPQRAYVLSAKKLDIQVTTPIKSRIALPNDETFDFPEEFMLKTILLNETDPRGIVITALRQKQLIEFYLYYIQKNPDPIFIEPLFNRLEGKIRPSFGGLVAETLLSYNDNKVNKRLLDIRNNNPDLRENESVTNLMKQKGIIK